MSLADTILFFFVLFAAFLGLVAFVNEVYWRIAQRYVRLRAETNRLRKELEPEEPMQVLRPFHIERD